MARPFTPKIVTANDLLEGDVIYMTKSGGWSRYLEDAFLLTNAEQAEQYLAMASQQQETLVGAYLADAKAGKDGAPEPTHFREVFRMTGPSNYFHGKQASA